MNRNIKRIHMIDPLKQPSEGLTMCGIMRIKQGTGLHLVGRIAQVTCATCRRVYEVRKHKSVVQCGSSHWSDAFKCSRIKGHNGPHRDNMIEPVVKWTSGIPRRSPRIYQRCGSFQYKCKSGCQCVRVRGHRGMHWKGEDVWRRRRKYGT